MINVELMHIQTEMDSLKTECIQRIITGKSMKLKIKRYICLTVYPGRKKISLLTQQLKTYKGYSCYTGYIVVE